MNLEKTPQQSPLGNCQAESGLTLNEPPPAPTEKRAVVRRKRQDLVGMTFNRLTVISAAPDWVKWSEKGVKQTMARWLCRCSCEKQTEVVVMGGHLKKGAIGSCGCIRDEKSAARFRTHGATSGGKTRAYRIWAAMKTRCTNPRQPGAVNYVNKGITVCPEWLNSYEAFLADMGECPPTHSIERNSNALGYCKENCRWATRKEQANNKTNNHFLEHGGERMTIAQWAERIGVGYMQLFKRINDGMPTADALTLPFPPVRHRIVRNKT